MNKLSIFLFASILLSAAGAFAQKSVVVTNTTSLDRKAELTEVRVAGLKADFQTKTYVLKNEKGEEIPYQLSGNGKDQTFLFQATVKANSSSTYTLSEGKPAIVKAKTFGRFIPERKDDFAWENDFGAYRMYGPALAKENPSNGVDYWGKRTEELIVDEFYHGELKQGFSYHRDRGRGLDFYKVGHTLGCGGIAPYVSDSLWVGNHFNSYKVLENGPLRTVFSLTYDSVKVGNDYYKQIITITADAGSLLNKAVVTYNGKKQKMQLAPGVFLHDGKGDLKLNAANGTATYTEVATSEFGEPSGRNYVGVVVPAKVSEGKRKGIHAFLVADYKAGSSFTYYFGGGWSKWKFETDNDWFKAVNDFTTKIKKPLKIQIK